MYNDIDDLIYGLSGAMMVFVIVLILGALLVRILFLLNLHKTLEAVSPENRTMEPGLVWLALIPLFAWIWQFFIVSKIGESLKVEFQSRDIAVKEDKPTYNTGLAWAILTVCAIIPFIGGLAGLAGFVFMIIYWVKTAEYKKQLLNHSF